MALWIRGSETPPESKLLWKCFRDLMSLLTNHVYGEIQRPGFPNGKELCPNGWESFVSWHLLTGVRSGSRYKTLVKILFMPFLSLPRFLHGRNERTAGLWSTAPIIPSQDTQWEGMLGVVVQQTWGGAHLAHPILLLRLCGFSLYETRKAPKKLASLSRSTRSSLFMDTKIRSLCFKWNTPPWYIE